MPDTSTLYDDVILDHIKNARNYRLMESADRKAEGFNPLCGDSFTVYVQLDGDVIHDASFQCSCCGISMASASVMTDAVKGRTIASVKELHERFMALLSNPDALEREEDISEVAVLSVVRDFPSRRNCAALAWHTLAAALDSRDNMVLGG